MFKILAVLLTTMVGTVFKRAWQARIPPWMLSKAECGSEHPPRHIVPTIVTIPGPARNHCFGG
jgi:hypothetical protein